jgi:hypothetical protein
METKKRGRKPKAAGTKKVRRSIAINAGTWEAARAVFPSVSEVVERCLAREVKKARKGKRHE